MNKEKNTNKIVVREEVAIDLLVLEFKKWESNS